MRCSREIKEVYNASLPIIFKSEIHQISKAIELLLYSINKFNFINY